MAVLLPQLPEALGCRYDPLSGPKIFFPVVSKPWISYFIFVFLVFVHMNMCVPYMHTLVYTHACRLTQRSAEQVEDPA